MQDLWRKYLLSFASIVLTSVALLVFNKLTIWWVFLIVLLLWLGGLGYLVFLRNHKKNFKQSLFLLLTTAVSFLSLILLLEIVWIKYFVSILLIGVLFFLIFTSQEKSALSYLDKPLRRFIVMLWVMNLFCLVSFFFAVDLFFQNISFWLIGLIISLLAGLVSVNIWKNYFSSSFRSFLFWFILVVLLAWEISWVLHFLPFGYLVLGFLFTWVWYIINLLIRFNLTAQGIIWEKQLFFLISNFILYFLFLFFFVRWI